MPDARAGGCIEATFGCLVGIGWLIAGSVVLALLILVAVFVFAAIL